MRSAKFITLLMIVTVFFQPAAFAGNTNITEYEQDIVKNCISLKIKIPKDCEYLTVTASRTPVEDDISADDFSKNLVAVTQIKAASGENAAELYYDEKSINTEKLYIYIAADGKKCDSFSMDFKTREQTVTDSFKSAQSWNEYDVLIQTYNKEFNMFDIEPTLLTHLSSLNQTASADVYKAMYRKRGEFLSVADIEKAYSEAIESVYAENGKQTTGGGGSGSTPNPNVIYIPPEKNSQSSNDSENMFSDMSGYSWAQKAVNELRKRNIVSGVTENSFNPGGIITREDFVKIIIAAAGVELTGNKTAFSDVTPGAYYEKYVNTAYENGIVTGIGGENFGTGEPVLRQDIAVIIYRAFFAEKDGRNNLNFTDSEDISPYAAKAVSALSESGIISGMEDGSFRPKEYATRAQAAQIIYNLINTGKL